MIYSETIANSLLLVAPIAATASKNPNTCSDLCHGKNTLVWSWVCVQIWYWVGKWLNKQIPKNTPGADWFIYPLPLQPLVEQKHLEDLIMAPPSLPLLFNRKQKTWPKKTQVIGNQHPRDGTRNQHKNKCSLSVYPSIHLYTFILHEIWHLHIYIYTILYIMYIIPSPYS